MTSGHDNMTR